VCGRVVEDIGMGGMAVTSVPKTRLRIYLIAHILGLSRRRTQRRCRWVVVFRSRAVHRRHMLGGMADVTQILSAIEAGDQHAAEQLLPLVYDELRKLAAQKLAHEKPGQTLQATALVHEAYLRLVDAQQARRWNSRGHFFAAAAEAIRRILVDQARRKLSLRRGSDLQRLPLEGLEIEAPEPSVDLLAVHEALDRFQDVDPIAAQIVKLRYFAGMTIPQAAEALSISTSTADRCWAYARAWLHAALKHDGASGIPE
jgi:RNA polymerase sigma factor (TIGR02999 family)